MTPWTPAASALRRSVPTFWGSSRESSTRTNGASPRSAARARMSSSDAKARGSTTRATPWWPSKPASAVSEPPSSSTIGIRRRVAWSTSFSSGSRRCGTTSRRMRRPAGGEGLLDRASAGDELLPRDRAGRGPAGPDAANPAASDRAPCHGRSRDGGGPPKDGRGPPRPIGGPGGRGPDGRGSYGRPVSRSPPRVLRACPGRAVWLVWVGRRADRIGRGSDRARAATGRGPVPVDARPRRRAARPGSRDPSRPVGARRSVGRVEVPAQGAGARPEGSRSRTRPTTSRTGRWSGWAGTDLVVDLLVVSLRVAARTGAGRTGAVAGRIPAWRLPAHDGRPARGPARRAGGAARSGRASAGPAGSAGRPGWPPGRPPRDARAPADRRRGWPVSHGRPPRPAPALPVTGVLDDRPRGPPARPQAVRFHREFRAARRPPAREQRARRGIELRLGVVRQHRQDPVEVAQAFEARPASALDSDRRSIRRLSSRTRSNRAPSAADASRSSSSAAPIRLASPSSAPGSVGSSGPVLAVGGRAPRPRRRGARSRRRRPRATRRSG